MAKDIKIMTAIFLVFFSLFCGCGKKIVPSIVKSQSDSLRKLKPQSIQILRDALEDNEPQIRVRAIEVVSETKQSELMPIVQRLLTDDFVPVRFAAALAVGDMRYTPAKPTLARLIQVKEDNTKIASAYALSKLGMPQGLNLIRKALQSNDQIVRANAVTLLGKAGNVSDIELLRKIQQEEKSKEKARFQALEARARLGDSDALKRLWAIAFSSYADDRAFAIKALGALGTQKAKEIIFTKLDDDVLEVQLTAAEQLGMLGDNSGEPEILKVFEENLTTGMDAQEVERVKVLATLAIGKIKTSSLSKYLPTLLADRSKTVRIAAAKAVLQCLED